MLRSDLSGATATFDIGTGAFDIQGTGLAVGTRVYFYPGFPVMGLLTFENTPINAEKIIGFDTRYAYEYVGGWERLNLEGAAGDAVWTGTNSDFFWATTYFDISAAAKVFFVTNYNENEPNHMRRFDGASTWNEFRPLVSTGVFCNSARCIVVFKNRLLLFNTWEGAGTPGTNYVNRLRYSWIGDPLNVNAFNISIKGFGGALDAATTEAIVSVEFIKDRLIVFFERSTWELVYTGNQVQPFSWQKINTELGVESTFSVVPFDRIVLGIGQVGIHACTGASVDRIDSRIPDETFAIHNASDGVFRVYGIRDYFIETVYWTFPDVSADNNFPYPNKVLTYNYRTNTWAFFDDSITCFGYYQPATGITWDSQIITWDDDVTWDSGALQSLFRQVIAGNQEGYTFICDSDVRTNASALQITNITATPLTQIACIDHNIRVGEYVFIEGATYSDASNGLNGQIFEVTLVIDKDNFNIGPIASFTGTYQGGGTISRVSNISIKTKEYNFYADKGRNAYISKVDFMVDRTDFGQIQVDFFVSTAYIPFLQESATNGVLIGTGTLDTYPYTLANGAQAPLEYEMTASRLWHPVYFQAEGEVIQLQLTMNDAQMRDTNIRLQDFQLHALVITATATSQRLQ